MLKYGSYFLQGFEIQWFFNRIGWTLFHVHKPRHHTDLTNTSNTEPWWMSGKRVWGYMCQFGVGKTRLQQKRCRRTFETFESLAAVLNSPLSIKMHHIIQIGLCSTNLLRLKRKAWTNGENKTSGWGRGGVCVARFALLLHLWPPLLPTLFGLHAQQKWRRLFAHPQHIPWKQIFQTG